MPSPLDILWFIYPSLMRWRTSRVAYFLMLGFMQFYIMRHGVDVKNPNPLDTFLLANYTHMVFPGIAGLIVGTLWLFMISLDLQFPLRMIVYIILGGLSIFFANDVRYALWSSFL